MYTCLPWLHVKLHHCRVNCISLMFCELRKLCTCVCVCVHVCVCVCAACVCVHACCCMCVCVCANVCTATPYAHTRYQTMWTKYKTHISPTTSEKLFTVIITLHWQLLKNIIIYNDWHGTTLGWLQSHKVNWMTMHCCEIYSLNLWSYRWT